MSLTNRAWVALLAAGSLALAAGVTGCGKDDSSASSSSSSKDQTVTLLTHDAFNLPDDVKKSFEKDTGLKLKIVAGDSGQKLVSKLLLTKDAPVADAVYGFTGNTSGQLEGKKVIADAGAKVPPGGDQFALKGLPGAVAVDTGDVCVNIDPSYFSSKNLAEPATLDDLVKPEYKDLMVTPDPAQGDTGLAFLYATIAAKGNDGWQGYWKQLLANGLKVDPSWSEAWEKDFTAGGGNGKYPIVVSYASSPAATVSKDGASAGAKSLDATCFAQTEYVGVLEKAKNPAGAKKVVEWLTSEQVQKAIPDSMYMYPVREGVALPDAWSKFAPRPDETKVFSLEPKQIAKNREAWLSDLESILGQ